jgi:hypothetical protein
MRADQASHFGFANPQLFQVCSPSTSLDYNSGRRIEESLCTSANKKRSREVVISSKIEEFHFLEVCHKL